MVQPYKCIYLEVVSLKISLESLKINFIFCTRRSQYTKNVSTVSVYEQHWGELDPPRLTRVHTQRLSGISLSYVNKGVDIFRGSPHRNGAKVVLRPHRKGRWEVPGCASVPPSPHLEQPMSHFQARLLPWPEPPKTLVTSTSQMSNFTEKQLTQKRHLWCDTKLQSGLSPFVIQ